MRIISTIVLAALAIAATGCISYSRHDTERVVEHRSGSYHAQRGHAYGGYYDRDRHDRHDHDHWHGH